MKSLGLSNEDIDYRPNGKSCLMAFVRSVIFRYLVVLLPLLLLFNDVVDAQLVGSPSSGQSAVQYCAPNAQYVVRYQYEVSFGVVPSGWFRMLFRLEDQTGAVIATKNYFNNATLNEITIVKDINPPFNWLIQRAHTFTLPPNDNCEYNARIWFYEDPERDGTYSVVDLTQVQVLANWHTDDEGDGNIDITPPIHEVCEAEALLNFQFQDASVFACTAATLPVLSKPNFYERYVQFVYNTSALAAQGIPNVTISVYGTPVQLTDATGAPMPNWWNVNPLDGSIVAPYATNSGYFEGPIISTGLNATGGSQQTFPISYPAGGSVVNDYFEVTLRNWNFCNKWNGSQTNPNAVDARTDVARIVIVDAPPAPTVPNVSICEGGNRTLTVTSAPAVGQYHWFSDAALTNQVAVGVSTYLPPETTVGSYDYYVFDQGITGLLCIGPATRVDLNIYPVISNNNITADQTICYNTPAAILNGTPPSGGDGNYVYLWQQSTVAAGGPWGNAAGTNNGQNYDPGSLIATTWYRRIVTSLTTCSSTSNVIRVQVTPNNTITRTSAAGTINQTVCINTPITQIRYTTTGATGATFAGLPPGVTGTWAASVITIDGSPNTTVGSPFNYTITLTGGCGTVTATGTISVTPNNTITRTSAVGTDNQAVCINTPITNITYSTTGATGASITGLPTGVTGSWAANTVTITGTPSVTAGSPYNYTIALNGGCGAITAGGTITVNPLPVPTITGAASVCLNSTHNYSTEAGMTGYNWTVSAGGTINSGAGTNAISVTWNTVGSKTVRVTYTNAGLCTGTSPDYSVLVGDTPTGANITGSTVCIGSSGTIRVTITGGAPDYTILIPEYSATPVSGYVSGTDINVGPLALGNHTYTLSSAQDACGIAVPGLPKTATVIVNANNTINRTSAVGTDNQTVCVNTPITNITYATTGASGATITGLPTGVTGSWAANVVTITGTPSVTAGSPYNYTITLNGGCGTITATGTIRVTPDNTITRTSAAGTDAQTVCINTPITNITYATTGATGATITGLPTGVTGSWAANVVTITGTPSVLAGSPYTYTISLNGGCGTVSTTGTIGVIATNTINRTSAAGTDNQTVCVNTPITNITYATTGATGATITGLPTGVTGSWAANVVTITGTPSVTAGSPYTYTISLNGGCGTVSTTGVIRVTPNNTIARTSAAGTDAQTVCVNTPITNITYATTGAIGGDHYWIADRGNWELGSECSYDHGHTKRYGR